MTHDKRVKTTRTARPTRTEAGVTHHAVRHRHRNGEADYFDTYLPDRWGALVADRLANSRRHRGALLHR